MPVNRTPVAGSRTRSISDSESDRISSAVRLLDPNKDIDRTVHSPTLRGSVNLDLSKSNPNISPPGSGMIETPLGVGLGTRFQTRNNPRIIEQQERAEKVCKDLMKDIDVWMIAMKSSPPPELLVLVEGYERFKRRIQRASEEAILRRLSTQYTFQLSDYLVKLQTLRNRAERRERRDLNNIRSRASTSTNESEGEEENVFDDCCSPPPFSGDNIQTEAEESSAPDLIHIESEPEKNIPSTASGKSPISKSLDDIISVVKNSHHR